MLSGVGANQRTSNHRLEGSPGPRAAHDAAVLQSRCIFHDLFSQSPTILNILSSYLYNKEQIYNARFNYGMWAMLATHIKSKCEHQQQQNGQKIVMFL